MKMKEYAKFIAVLAEKYPDAQAIYALDEEGNGFEPVDFAPIAGQFGGDFHSKTGDFNGGIAGWSDHGSYVPDPDIAADDINAVCIN